MKRLLTAILCLGLFAACSTNRYLLSGSGTDKNYLIDKITEAVDQGLISPQPLVVIDGEPYRYEVELKSERLDITKSQIRKIDILKKDEGVKLYGIAGDAGVLVIELNSKRWTKDQVILYLVDGKVISKEELKMIQPSEIESINIVKNKNEFKLYTNKKCDGLVVIRLKKKE